MQYRQTYLVYNTEMKTTDNEKGGNLKSAGGLGAAPGPQAGSRGEAPVGDQGAKPPEKYGFSAISGPIFYRKLVSAVIPLVP